MSHVCLSDYDPPMPALRVQLGYPAEALSLGPLTAIIDTGVDATLVPQTLLDDIGAPLVAEARIRSHWGERRGVEVFAVDISLAGLRLPASR